MTSIDDIIRREVNPFDPTTFKPGNFWQEQQDSQLTVNSIHQEAIVKIEASLNLVVKDHHSRTVLLSGDSGSGKSYLLGRLKRTLNRKAFFAYIGSWADSDFIWRHILRYTVDSLMHVPEGQQESQLMIWLKSLAAFKQLSMKQLIFNESVFNLLRSDRQKFIKQLKKTYNRSGIYNADNFFGVLHDLTNPEKYDLACEWLRGEDLSEESLQLLKVKHSIETEDAAKNTLANFGKISSETQPIVLCFDNLDNIPRLPDGFIDLQSLFNVNTTIHNDYLKNFLIIISIITDTWNKNADRVQKADQARIERKVHLKPINLDQAEALFASRLQPLHHLANPQPDSQIYPLTREELEQKFPRGKTYPRYVLSFGQQRYQYYKKQLEEITDPTVSNEDNESTGSTASNEDKELAAFKLIWQHEHNKVKSKISKITLLAATELIKMLQESLAALQIPGIKPKLLSGRFASYSLSYQQNSPKKQIGIVWTEDSSMNSFVHVMNACQKVVQQNICQNFYLIRAADVGRPNLVGNQIYRQIFTGSHHRHIKPIVSSVHSLATYHNLVNSALANELVIIGETISLEKLQALVRKTDVLQDCRLLQDLGLFSGASTPKNLEEQDFQPVKKCLLNIVTIQQFLGRQTLIQSARSYFPNVNEAQINQLIEELCQEKQIQVLDPKAKPEAQLICLVPKTS